MSSELAAQLRETTGKGPARRLRQTGKIPGIIYGSGKDQVKISLDINALQKLYNKGNFLSKVINLVIDNNNYQVLPREVQVNPVTDIPTHADFLQVDDNSIVNVWVKVKFHNADKAPGIKRGGVLNIVRHKIELLCPANAIPEELDADLDGLIIGDSIHISKVAIPEECSLTITDRDFTVATIAGRMKEAEAVATTDEGEDGEEGEEAEGEATEGETSEESSE